MSTSARDWRWDNPVAPREPSHARSDSGSSDDDGNRTVKDTPLSKKRGSGRPASRRASRAAAMPEPRASMTRPCRDSTFWQIVYRNSLTADLLFCVPNWSTVTPHRPPGLVSRSSRSPRRKSIPLPEAGSERSRWTSAFVTTSRTASSGMEGFVVPTPSEVTTCAESTFRMTQSRASSRISGIGPTKFRRLTARAPPLPSMAAVSVKCGSRRWGYSPSAYRPAVVSLPSPVTMFMR